MLEGAPPLPHVITYIQYSCEPSWCECFLFVSDSLAFGRQNVWHIIDNTPSSGTFAMRCVASSLPPLVIYRFMS